MNKEDDFMSDYDNAIFRLATAQGAEPEDYTGEDGKCPQTEMCTPVRITGENFRKAAPREKMEQLKKLLNGKEICL